MALDVLFIGILGLGAALVGGRFVDASGLKLADRWDRLALAVPIGLGLMALVVFVLGEFGCLSATTIGLGLVGMVAFSRLICWSRDKDTNGDVAGPSEATVSAHLADAFLIVGLLGTFLTALTPVTDGDALAYHLQLPRTFLENGSLRFDPYQHESAYPMVVELLYAIGLAWRGPVACRLICWLLGVCLMLGVTALARPVLGARARWAGTIALLVPAISNGMTAPLTDVPLAAFAVSALLAWSHWREDPSARKAVLAGALAGLTIGVKYPGLVWVGLLALATVVPGPRRRRHIFNHMLIYLFMIFVTGAFWYLRAWWFTGNPVYPFFRSVFGGSGIAEVLLPGRRPLGLAPWKLLTALVPMTLDPARFESRWHQLGPVFLAFLPILVFTRPPRRVWGLVGFGYVFFTLCLTMRQSPRFSLAALGPMAVGVAWVASWAVQRRDWARPLIAGSLAIVLTGESAWSVYRARHGLGVLTGRESADEYLARREPTHRVGSWMRDHLPPNARLIGQEQRGYYFPRPYTIERRHRLATGVGIPGQDPARIIESYRSEGFTHLLMCPPVPESAAFFDPALSRALEGHLASRVPLFQEEITDPEGVTRRYAIYELGRPEQVATR